MTLMLRLTLVSEELEPREDIVKLVDVNGGAVLEE